ncbi:hypothetical protein Asulf_01472 [Archaeoglobus sulfaticallidus PM70-1]|uniref:Uncharacterized protein n=2 Tax=Archaeoglobus TaxID=2233 RepID=N0BMG6_9EURY|nr:hypothetical protein Asulf_01472 [Archaeoglobus sulfaticallidus PM70-1]
MTSNEYILPLIKKLEHLKTRIVFDSRYPMLKLLFHYVIPCFSSKRQIFVVFSDTMCRWLENAYLSFKEESPKIVEILRNASIIKIGFSEDVPFGRLYEQVPYGNPKETLSELEDLLSKLKNDDLLVCYGTHLIPALYGANTLSSILRIFDILPKWITLFAPEPDNVYERHVDNLIQRFYDVILRIKKEEEYVSFGEETYLIGVDQSYIRDIQPGFAKFCIEKDGKLVRISQTFLL